MTGRDPSQGRRRLDFVKPEDTNDTRLLHRLEPGHRLLDPPSGPAPPVTDPQIQTLPFRDLSWPDFQKLVVSIARDVEGHREAYEYGTTGQAQHGLDILAIGEDSNVHAYQARNVSAFGASDLRRAVEDFASGKRPNNPRRFVVVVACNTDRTHLLDELAELRRAYARDFAIDLYGEATLSEMLRRQPEIVQRFFGTATAERFCVGTVQQPVAQRHGRDEMPTMQIADAVLRGPVDALGLNSRLTEADRLFDSHPLDAARNYMEIAEELASAGWPGHALMLKRRAADALAAAGEQRAAGRLVAQLFWTYLDLGAEAESQTLRYELTKLSEKVPDDEVLASWAQVVAEAHSAVGDPLDRLEGLATTVDELRPGADIEIEALVLLCELALTSDQPGLILDRAAHITEAAKRAPSASDQPSLDTRLRLCLADATGDWSNLLSDVRKRALNPWEIALVLGRHGRHLAWHNEPDLARDAFRQAIERGVLLGANDDASEWIHSTRYLDIRYGPISDQVNEAYRRIQALNTAGSGARLYRHLTNPRERVLRYLHDEKYPAAADAGRRFLRECVVAGHWGSEFEAHAFLGNLFATTGEPARATRHYIRAGAQEKLESLLRNGPYVDVRAELSRPTPWERAAAYRAIATEADLVPDDHVDEIVAAALADARAVVDGLVRQSGSAPEVLASAVAALAPLVERASQGLGAETLKLLSPFVQREAGTYRFTDTDHIRALAGIVRGHEAHKDEALQQLGQALATEGPLSDTVLKVAGNLLASEEAATPLLHDLASQGNEQACLLLAVRGIASPEVLEQAEEAFNRVMERPPPTRGRVTFGTTLPQDAQRIGLLPIEQRDTVARRLMEIAQETLESDRNRADALEAVSILAGALSADVRGELYSQAMRFATGESSESDLSPDLRQEPHPLSWFKFSFSPGPLEAYGLKAAARLAQTTDETDAVVRVALELLPTADDTTTDRVAAMLSWISGDRLTASQAILASQPDASLRALAAVLWVRDPERSPELGAQLASDPSALVRRTLASQIASTKRTQHHDTVVAQLLIDERHSVRKLLRDVEQIR